MGKRFLKAMFLIVVPLFLLFWLPFGIVTGEWCKGFWFIVGALALGCVIDLWVDFVINRWFKD